MGCIVQSDVMATRSTARWRVGMRVDAFSIHHWSIWCGLTELHHKGVIELGYITGPAPAGSGLWLQVEDREQRAQKTIWVDISDRAPDASARRDAADSSWVRNAVDPIGRPLGFVAPMRSGFEPVRRYVARSAIATIRARRSTELRGSISALLRKPFVLPVGDFEADPGGAPAIVFQVRAWEPHESKDPNDRHRVNDVRATLIRQLRQRFGDRFTGGFTPSVYANDTYPDLLTNAPIDRPSYLHLIRQNAVVISSTGLHGSIPWKIAEYLAASRAIVSEPFVNKIPCSVSNVIEFYTTPDECISACDNLLTDAALRNERQKAAHDLWQSQVRPDQLVLARLAEEFE